MSTDTKSLGKSALTGQATTAHQDAFTFSGWVDDPKIQAFSHRVRLELVHRFRYKGRGSLPAIAWCREFGYVTYEVENDNWAVSPDWTGTYEIPVELRA